PELNVVSEPRAPITHHPSPITHHSSWSGPGPGPGAVVAGNGVEGDPRALARAYEVGELLERGTTGAVDGVDVAQVGEEERAAPRHRQPGGAPRQRPQEPARRGEQPG